METGKERSPQKINKQTGQIQETATEKPYAPVNTSNVFRKKSFKLAKVEGDLNRRGKGRLKIYGKQKGVKRTDQKTITTDEFDSSAGYMCV